MNENKPSILVVDDEKDTCANLQDILTDMGFHVDVAYDGFSALKLVEKHPYDVALLDLKMPGMDGLELYRRIKKLQSGTVAIIVTAYASSDTAQAAQEAGAWEILPKPVEFPTLLSLVDQALEQPLILVVDDDHDLCDNLWDLFRERGYRTCLAHTPAEAAKQMDGREHSVVLIDMKLEAGSGREVFQMVRSMTPTARTVLITGYRGEMELRVQEVLRAGADAACYKPFDVEKLLETVRGLVSAEKDQTQPRKS